MGSPFCAAPVPIHRAFEIVPGSGAIGISPGRQEAVFHMVRQQQPGRPIDRAADGRELGQYFGAVASLTNHAPHSAQVAFGAGEPLGNGFGLLVVRVYRHGRRISPQGGSAKIAGALRDGAASRSCTGPPSAARGGGGWWGGRSSPPYVPRRSV